MHTSSQALSLLFIVLVIFDFCLTYSARIPGLQKRDVRQYPSCWTCPPGFLHYWDLGRTGPTNGDQCQCLPASTPATTAPPGSQYCWTCPAGFTHWWKLGMAYPSNGDKCQCVQGGSPATNAPAPAPVTAPPGSQYCWTCPPGYTHWWKLGMSAPSNGDKCQCVAGGASPATTTRAPATPASTPSCWTCPSGMLHWYELGLPQPADKCACFPVSTTKAPTSAPAPVTAPPGSQYCWTCPSGFTHWWKLGMSAPSNGDKCQCVQGGAPATNAPAPAPATPASTPSCWTCPPGMLHWYELGLPQPSDKCACYASNRPVTNKPNCWPCPSGQSHWFDIGFSAPTNGDQCQCIPSAIGATTKAPVPNCWTCPSGMSHWWEQNLSQPPSGDRCQCLNIPAAVPQTEAMKRFIQYMTPTATSPGSISFSPIVAPYAPWNLPPYQLMEQLLVNIKATTNFRVIMTYGLTTNMAALAQKHGFKLLGIINLVSEYSTNARNIQDGITAARQYADTIIAVACGNEVGLAYGTGSNTAAIINGCLTNVRNSGIKHPIGVVDIYNSWNQNGKRWSAVSDNADWIGINTYPWYDNMYALPPFTCATPDNAGEHTLTSVTRLENLYYPKPVILTEYGWPGAPAGSTVYNKPNAYTGKSCTYGNDYAQAKAVQNILNTFRKVQKPCNLFSGYREPWKGSNSESVEEFWGTCDSHPPYSCYNVPK